MGGKLSIIIISIDDIKKGDHILYEYGVSYDIQKNWKMNLKDLTGGSNVIEKDLEAEVNDNEESLSD